MHIHQCFRKDKDFSDTLVRRTTTYTPPTNALFTQMWRAFYSNLSADLLNSIGETTQIWRENYSILSIFLAIEEINSTSVRYNNLEPTTYRNGAMSGKTDFHVDISKSPRGKEKIPRRNEMKLRRNEMKLRKKWITPTWKKKNIHVEIWDSPRGYSRKEGIGRISP